MKKISLIIPCYNEEASLPLLYPELKQLMDSQKDYDWEVLFIDDGSKDQTLAKIKHLRGKDKRIAYVALSRNFGKERAMLAGFDYAKGDCAIILDADLQHPPHIIPQMIELWQTGYDDVYAKRISRGKESWLRKRFSLMYYKLLQKLTKVQILQNVGDFRLLDRKCLDALKRMRECERYTKGMFSFIGFRKKEILFEQGDRMAGQTSWNFWKLLSLGIDGITSFTVAPLRISTFVGFVVSLIALIYMCVILVKTIFFGETVQGFPTLITVVLFLGGIQLLTIGIIGEYVGRIFNETKNRPVYFVQEYEGED